MGEAHLPCFTGHGFKINFSQFSRPTGNRLDPLPSAEPIEGFVDDYSNLIRGLLDLYEACFDQSWLEWAGSLQAKQDELFWDAENGGYYGASSKDPSIKLRLKEGKNP